MNISVYIHIHHGSTSLKSANRIRTVESEKETTFLYERHEVDDVNVCVYIRYVRVFMTVFARNLLRAGLSAAES